MLLTILLFIDCSKMWTELLFMLEEVLLLKGGISKENNNGANRNQHQDSYQRETVSDKFVFFSKLVRPKMSIGWAKYVYACAWDMCWRNFCNFTWWLKNVKSRSKIAPFFKWGHFEIWFPKKGVITFFWSKLSKLHKKTQFCMWQLHFP